MSAVTIRWHDADNVGLFVDGRQVFSVSNLDEDGGREGEPNIAWAAEQTADALTRALGATVTIERPTQ